MHVRAGDANSPDYDADDWKAIIEFNLFGDPSVSLFGERAKSNNDVVLLLDGSGSMLSEGKWGAAKDAAVLFHKLTHVLRHPSFQDRYRGVVFRWPCSGPDDTTTAVPVPPPDGLLDATTPLTLATFNPYEPESNYCTPIGKGLEKALVQFDLGAEESFYNNKSVVLLSDGMHNRGIDPGDVDVPAEVTVYAVGLGDDSIEPATIEDIANATGGDYVISPQPRDTEGFFCQIFCDTSWKLQEVPVVGGEATIDQDPAVFIVVWDDPSRVVSFDLDPPGESADITPSDTMGYPPMVCEYHAPAVGETHALYVCENIPDALYGDWAFANIRDSAGPVADADVLLKVLEDPRVIADFDVEDVDHYTGQPIVLTARITQDGRPFTGLSGVYAELISSPEYAPGDLMAENEPPPGYPAEPPAGSDASVSGYYLLGVMEGLGLEHLSTYGGPTVPLRDDGSGGDLRPDDGIYTGSFDGATKEGSYTFWFYAGGTNAAGRAFERTTTLSDYVEVGISSGETDVEVTSSAPVPGADAVATVIKVTPRDAFGAHLGPFRGDRIELWATAGKFESDYVDHRDGSYSFTLVHPPDVTPAVSVAVGDVVAAHAEDLPGIYRPARFTASLHAGLALPLGDFADAYDPGIGVQADFERALYGALRLRAVVGYNRFGAKAAPASDTSIINVNAYLKYDLLGGAVVPFVEAGPGYYVLDHTDDAAGASAGGGLWFRLGSRWGVEVLGNYHGIFTDPRTDYADVSAGLTFAF